MENVDDLMTPRFQEFAEAIMHLYLEKDDLEYCLMEDADMDAQTYNGILSDLAQVRLSAQRVLNEWEDWKKMRLKNTTDG
jgi:hypothetical protein